VIFLAQQAADADAPVAAPRPTVEPGGWFSGWRLALIPAAVFATVLVLLVVFYPRQAGQTSQIAQVTPQSVPAQPAPVTQTHANTSAPHPAVLAKPAESKMKSATLSAPAEGFAPGTLSASAPPAAPGTADFSTAENSPALISSLKAARAAERNRAAEQYNSGPAVSAWQQQQQNNNSLGGIVAAPAMQKSTAMDNAKGGQADLGYAVTRQDAIQSTANFESADQAASAKKERNAKASKLSSGLAVLSTANAGQHTLAVDLAGALFLSEDAGKHWQPVARQWTGRAVNVRTQAGAGFLLTNDSGATWTSADGKIWTAQ
jgi:hypothetical protein